VVVAALGWEAPVQASLTVWLPDAPWLDLQVSLQQRGAQRRGEVRFRVRVPQRQVSGQVPLQQVRGVDYLAWEHFQRLWAHLGYFMQLQGQRLPHWVALEPEP
jgi:hypothetical protein